MFNECGLLIVVTANDLTSTQSRNEWSSFQPINKYKWLKQYFTYPSGYSAGYGFKKGPTMDENIWNNCNSLRYGFDENYDSPIFDDEDEDNIEETETNEWSFLLL